MSSWFSPSSRPKGRSVLDRLAQSLAQARRRQDAAHRRAWRDAQHDRQKAEWDRLPPAERRCRLTKAALAGFIEAAGDPSTLLHREGFVLCDVDTNCTPPPADGQAATARVAHETTPQPPTPND